MKPPDRKELELAEHYRNRIASDIFDERDVAALLITLRLVLDPNPVLFELGSFLAHRRRTKGDFHRFFAASVQASRTSEGLRLGMDAQPLYSSADILDSINRALSALGLPPLPMSVADELVFCLISLLQDVTFEDRTNASELGRIFLAFNADEIFAIAAVRVGDRTEQLVPVLRIPNRWINWQVPTQTPEGGTVFLAVPNHWLTVERTANRLTPVSH